MSEETTPPTTKASNPEIEDGELSEDALEAVAGGKEALASKVQVEKRDFIAGMQIW